MEHPEKVERRVETDGHGVRRLVEKRTPPDPANGGRSDSLLMLTSRPVRAGETPEQAAADSLAFTDTAAEPSRHIRSALFSAYETEFPDGSRRYESFARRGGARGVRRPVYDDPPNAGCKGAELRRRRRKDQAIGQRRGRGLRH